jgi:cobalt-zinc-cadmium efflux system protein
MEKHPSETNIKWALFLNLVFTLIEFAGGLWTQSLAILSDALHDLGDSTALGMAWFMERLSHKQRTSRHSYGYRRFSLLGALINAVILIAGGSGKHRY